MKLANYFLLTTLFVSPIFGSQPRWFNKIKQIKLLSTTRKDLGGIFGKPERLSEYGENFNIIEARLSFSYSTGNCANGWNISKGVIIEMGIFPLEPIKPILIGVSLKRLRFYKESDTPNIIYYDDILGRKYVTSRGKISEIWYSPNDKYDYLLCHKD